MEKDKGGRPRKLTKQQEQEIFLKHSQGQQSFEICYEYKISERTLHRILKRQ